MNRTKTALLLLSLLIGLSVKSQTAVEGQAYAEVIMALTAYENNQLSFGKFSVGETGGQLILSPDGVLSVQGSIHHGGGTVQPGKFIISGHADATFTVQLPTGPALLSNGHNHSMTVDNWNADPSIENLSGILSGGTETVSIGATLYVGPIEQNPIGIYTGTYSLTFAYN
jgi:hypothetical protein